MPRAKADYNSLCLAIANELDRDGLREASMRMVQDKVMSKKHEQRVACNSIQMREKIRKGHKRVEIKFLSEAEDGALRFPSLRRLM